MSDALSRADSCTVNLQESSRTPRTYLGSLERPERPQTPFYMPPWPIDLTPELHPHKILMRAARFVPGPEDSEGVPADHPDIIWQKGVRYKHVPGTRAPPFEMLQWSRYYHLPVGLHWDWPLFSSVAYGVRPSADTFLPPHSRREEVYARYRLPRDERINGRRPDTNIPASASIVAPPALHSPLPSPHEDLHTESGQPRAESSSDELAISLDAPPAQTLEPAPAVSTPQHSSSAASTTPVGLKRPRTPDDDVAERPVKRIAVVPDDSSERARFPLLRTDAARSPRKILPMALSRRPLLLRETVPEIVFVHASNTLRRNPGTSGGIPRRISAPIAVRDGVPAMRKRKRDAEAETEAVAKKADQPVVRAVTPSGKSPETPLGGSHIPTAHPAPRKRQRKANPIAAIRRSSRVREKAAAMVHSS